MIYFYTALLWAVVFIATFFKAVNYEQLVILYRVSVALMIFYQIQLGVIKNIIEDLKYEISIMKGGEI